MVKFHFVRTAWFRTIELRTSPQQGPLAQLGERRVRNAEVNGSIPLRSTNTWAPLDADTKF
jgi:hypothetical protein